MTQKEREVTSKYGIMNLLQNIYRKKEVLLMNMITQEAKKKQAIVKYAEKNGKSQASRMYGVSLSSIKRWCKKYDGTWQSMLEKSHRPHNHPKRHTQKEEKQIKNSFKKCYARYGWDGVYDDLIRKGYTRSFSGMVYAAKRLGLKEQKATKNKRTQALMEKHCPKRIR